MVKETIFKVNIASVWFCFGFCSEQNEISSNTRTDFVVHSGLCSR